MIKEINNDNLLEVINVIVDNSNHIDKLLFLFEGNIEKYKNRVLIKNISDNLNTVIIDLKNDNIDSIVFNGNHNLSFSDLVIKFGNFREIYVPYDDAYHYFFNEGNKGEKYVIVTVSSIDISSSKDYELKNISIMLYKYHKSS